MGHGAGLSRLLSKGGKQGQCSPPRDVFKRDAMNHLSGLLLFLWLPLSRLHTSFLTKLKTDEMSTAPGDYTWKRYLLKCWKKLATPDRQNITALWCLQKGGIGEWNATTTPTHPCLSVLAGFQAPFKEENWNSAAHQPQWLVPFLIKRSVQFEIAFRISLLHWKEMRGEELP